ncbi:MAG: helix-turn-helix domain-containing protein [Oscillospiraceae bacterium]|jgi:transcriptional regulator with XRE-family HTH domain|nr:helix-turn-helix domain-containing protein [Oscillospiraceae bacterium]
MKAYFTILRELREDNDLRQHEIAKLLKTTQQQYSKYEAGTTEMSIRALATLADYYNVSADYIMGRTDCREGVDGVNRMLTADCTAGAFVSEILSLSAAGRGAVIEYALLQRLKEKTKGS